MNGLFLKENIKLPWRIVVKQSDDFTIAMITRRHIVSAASRNSDIAIVFIAFIMATDLGGGLVRAIKKVRVWH